MQLYLNLATDRTFLFRDGQVSLEARVDGDRISAAMARVEQLLRTNRRFVPRYSELAYVRRHFEDLLQSDLPCAESQLKVMVHSTGEMGGCWGHDAKANVRDTPVAEILDSEAYREEHARFFRKECAGCGSNYALNLAWRPRTYVEDALWRVGRRQLVPPRARHEVSAPLYDRLAPTYVEHFDVAHRRAYDQLAWEMCAAALPDPPAVVVDVGCGVGRWARRLARRRLHGHRHRTRRRHGRRGVPGDWPMRRPR